MVKVVEEVKVLAEGKLKAEASAVESLKWIRIKMVKSL